MLRPPVAFQRFPDGLGVGFDAWIPLMQPNVRFLRTSKLVGVEHDLRAAEWIEVSRPNLFVECLGLQDD